MCMCIFTIYNLYVCCLESHSDTVTNGLVAHLNLQGIDRWNMDSDFLHYCDYIGIVDCIRLSGSRSVIPPWSLVTITYSVCVVDRWAATMTGTC